MKAAPTASDRRSNRAGALALPLAVLLAATGPATAAAAGGQPMSPSGAMLTLAGGGAAASAATGAEGFSAFAGSGPGRFLEHAARGGPLAPAAGSIGQGEAFLSSLLVPGLAQYRQGARRWIVYAGVEVLFLVRYLDARSDTRDLRAAYRDFAWAMARRGFSADPRRDGDFEYYERLSKWASSGAWDADPQRDGIQPEDDPATYNGSVWALAAEIYNLDPADPGQAAYARALQYYRERGYGPDLLWQWQSGSGDQDEFRTLITRSDRRARDTRLALWVVTANHLLSAVDGFVTARLTASPPTGEVGLVVTVPFR